MEKKEKYFSSQNFLIYSNQDGMFSMQYYYYGIRKCILLHRDITKHRSRRACE